MGSQRSQCGAQTQRTDFKKKRGHSVSRQRMLEVLESRQLLSSVISPFAAPGGSTALTGSIIGTAGSYASKGNIAANAMDGNTSTYFDAPYSSNCWVGLNLGSADTITQVQYVPRAGWASRMTGGVFQGSNSANFSSGLVTLCSITALPAAGVYSAVPVTDTGSYQYVRYVGPSGGYCNVAELEFDGISSAPVTPVVPVIPVTPAPPANPTTPTAFAATAVSSNDVHLAWQEDPGSTVSSFTIARQGPADSSFVNIASVAGTATAFEDVNALASTTYSYEVIANNSGGYSLPAVVPAVSMPAAPVSSWTDGDIGGVGFAGSAVTNASGSITVSGGGADIWNTNDAFNYDSQPLVGNGTVTLKVTGVTNTSGWAKSGIMIRETLNSDSRYVLLALTPTSGVTLQARTATHVTPSVSDVVAGRTTAWLELVRSGSTFTGYTSGDDTNWTLVGTATIPMVNNVFAGMAVTAHNNSKLCSATFSNISVALAGTAASVWSDGAAGPMQRSDPAAFSYNGNMYIFGGFIDRSLDATAECDMYNPSTNTWSELTTVPTGALTHAAVTLVGDTVYLAGGNIGSFADSANGVATAEVLTYDLTTGVWGSVASLPAPVTSGGMVCINNQLIYYGGINAASTADLSNTWALNLTNPNAAWTAEAAMPNARNHVGYVAVNGLAYAVGGVHLYKQTTGNVAEVDAYNPVTNTWSKVASLPMAWGGLHGTTMDVNGKIVIVGGQTNGGYDGIYLNNIEEYDPTANNWTAVGTLPEANQGESVAYINGTLIVTGGGVDNQGGWLQDQTWLDSAIVL